MAFDTLTYAKKLQEAGVPPQQAETHAWALKETVEDTLATKQDLQLVRQDVRDLETRMDGRFRLVYWMLGFDLALTVGILLKLLAG